MVIPTLNRWELVQRAVSSAGEGSELADLEIVVVDDGSDEPMPAALTQRPNVRVERHEARRGVAAARNTGVASARGEWVGFLDDDDLWAPNRMKTMVSALRERGADFAYSSAVIVRESLEPLYEDPAPDPDALLRLLLRGNAVPGGGSTVVARRSLLEQLGGFDEQLSFAADWDMWIRLAQAGRAVAVSDPSVAYVYGPNSWVLRRDPAIEADFHRVTAKHRAQAERFGEGPDQRAFERYLARSLFVAGRKADGLRAYASLARRHRSPAPLYWGLRRLASATLDLRSRAPSPAWLTVYRGT